MIDHTEAAQSIANTIAKIGAPLSHAQVVGLSGAVGVWMEKAREDGVKDGLDEIIGVMRELMEGME